MLVIVYFYYNYYCTERAREAAVGRLLQRAVVAENSSFRGNSPIAGFCRVYQLELLQ